MKKIIVFLFSILIILLSKNIYSQGGWIQQNSGCSSNLTSIFILDSSTIYVVGYGSRIIKTTNGGNNWNILNSGISSNYWSVWFLNQNTGLIIGDNILIRTTNGGINWNQSPLIHEFARDLIFFNSNTGYMYCEGVVGYYPYFYISKSTNAGVSWFDVSSWLGSEEGSYFCDINNGYISGYNNIYKTVNSCLNWTFISTGTYAYNYVLNFLNVDTGYIASGDDLNPFYIRKTTDGGYSWSNLYQITTPIFAGYFINSLTGFIGRNNILKTTNGGYNWYIQSSSYNTILYEIKFINQLTGFAIGDNGIILKTTNGGESTGISPINNNIPSDFSLSQNYPNPFNPTTKIKFDIPVDSRIRGNDRGRVVGSDRVVLRVYDILGKEIETLVNEKLNPGTYEVTFDASKYPSGVYFYRLITDNFTDTKRMILLK